MDKEVYLGLEKADDQLMEAALITVTSVLGSTPRKPGAKMLVFADGTTVGTIGGGCGEAEGRREALNVITTHTSKIYYLNMTSDVASEEGMVCGGIMGLFIDYLGPHRPLDQIRITHDYLSCFESLNPVLVTVIEAREQQLIGRKLYIKDNEEIKGDLVLEELTRIAVDNAKNARKWCQPVLVSLDSEFEPCDTTVKKAVYRLLVESRQAVVQLLILGAGHIAVPLAAMAKMVGYEVTVVDDRLSFANAYRFPTADRILCDDFERALDELIINPQTFVVIITRGHRYDKLCLRKVINQSASYTGMIGSRRRVKAMLTELEEEGIPSETLQKLYSPIGLKIGAETPEEIAVSILSELIKVQKELGQNGKMK
ncbi:xanthine and CO dehydrogenases maturation factor, XdhC/CoxF family [Desulfosporosinus orientis DSM 765]|uniref:Xanthine and CO dehydrogenases maturation factor, XdhC/CoxF family n=1 Tax=Desulfosporosinus orientis (strain ATCC 19365 / DSM 765 / NCIMB 8382 / VKM B-1628 / Singapore I) TaxID=768706 RepID=G7WEQ2_DESOD|nr:XdhC/CoxI family protein [Desulfosporosinus orientis]AET66943.1 xanthine and CO dehydrogenases maturation factor, XdhC/CoxF family [Desulfosporosinus orientis DSM 765]